MTREPGNDPRQTFAFERPQKIRQQTDLLKLAAHGADGVASLREPYKSMRGYWQIGVGRDGGWEGSGVGSLAAGTAAAVSANLKPEV